MQVNLNLSRGRGKPKVVKTVYVDGGQYKELKRLAVLENRDVGNLIIFILHEDCRSRDICVDPDYENNSILLAYKRYVEELELMPDIESKPKAKDKAFTEYARRLIREYLRKNKKKLQESC